MSIEIILILFTVGMAAGILSGIFGVGGGIIIVPSLISVYSVIHPHSEYAVQAAIATSLLTIVFTSISSAHKHYKNNNVITKAAIIIGLSSAVSVFLFSKVTVLMSGELLKKIFLAILITAALKMLFDTKYRNKTEGEEKDIIINKPICLLIGLLTGLVAAFTGLGGAVFAVPLLHYLMKVPIKKSIGTTTLAVMITAISGAISYIINSPQGAQISDSSIGVVDYFAAIPIVAGSVPAARLGVYFHNRIESRLLTRLFAVLVLFVCLKMIFF